MRLSCIRFRGLRLARILAAGAVLAAPAVGAASAASAPSIALSTKAPAAASLLAAATKNGSVRVIITLAAPQSAAARLAVPDDAALKASVKAVVEPFVTDMFAGTSTNRVQASAAAAAVKTMPFLPLVAAAVSASDLERIAADSRVAHVELDRVTPINLAQSVPLIGADRTRMNGWTGLQRTVAVLDSGVQYNHPFFAAGVIRGSSCHSTTGSGYTSLCPNGEASQYGGNAGINCTGNDDCIHGTHVAGIVAGNRPNNVPAYGVAPRAGIYSIQVFSRPSAGHLGAFTSDIIAGLQDVYAVRTSQSIAAANLSLGGGIYSGNCDDESIKLAIDQLRAAGVATVIAAGNDGVTDGVSFPACVSTAIAVGSTTKSDVISDFSNMGSLVDVMAPGSSITSSIPTSQFAALSGTSMAAPHVAGAFAVLQSDRQTATVSQMETALKQTGKAIADTRPGGTLSKPRINVYAALMLLRANAGLPVPPANDDFAKATTVVPAALDPTVVNGTTVNATLEPGEISSGVAHTVWWKFKAVRTEMVRISPDISANSNVISIYSGSSLPLNLIVTNNENTTADRAVQFATTSGVTYFVRMGVRNNGSPMGTFALTFGHPRPSNDDVFYAVGLKQTGTVVTTATGNNNFATLQPGEPRYMSAIQRTIWWKFIPTETRNYSFDTKTSQFDTTLGLYSGTWNALTFVAGNNSDGSLMTSRITRVFTRGTQYFIQLGGSGAARGNAVLNLSPVGPDNDMIAKAKALSGTPGIVTGTNSWASIEPNEILPIPAVQATAWWRFTATATKTITVSTAGSAFDTTLGVFWKDGTQAPSLVAFNDNDGALTTSRVSFAAVAGRVYYLQIGGNGTARGAIRLSFPAGASPLAQAAVD